MKKQLYISCFSLLGTLFLNAQTNTFPDSGNVGIGTLSPTTKLEVNGDVTVGNNGRVGSFVNIIGAGSHQSFGLQLGSASNPDSKASILSSTTWGGISFSVQENFAMQINSIGNVGIGTTNPSVKLDVENGDLYVGEEVSSNGQRRQIRIYGFDNSAKFYGSMHSNYDDSKRTFDISTNNYVQQIKIDASANPNANIILYPGDLGNVGIGTTTPDSKLTVKGNIHTNEVKVDLLGAVAPDYVFYKDYDLKSLKAVEDYIASNGHLPNIPSAKDMETEGIMLKEMNLKLLEKIEELTLYAIEQEKKLEAQEARLQKLEAHLNSKK